MLQKQSHQFVNWLNNNKVVLITVFAIYQVSILAIGIINYPYIDDIARQRDGGTGFAWSYSRWGSEIASIMVQGSRHLTDMGLTTHILTGVILAIASLIVLYCLTEKMTLLPAIVSTIIGLNPWFLQCISFRFDSPYMALSVLFSFLPFLWWKKNKYLFLGISFICLFLMCNTYQSSSGLYIVMALALTFKDLLAGRSYKKTGQKLFLGAVSYVCALLTFSFETTFNPDLVNRGNGVKMAQLKDIPKTFVTNIQMYFSQIVNQSSKMWILLVVILLILFIVSAKSNAKVSRIKAVIFSSLFVLLGSIFSYGVYLVFVEKLAELQPRYAYGFAVFCVITIILLLDNASFPVIKPVATVITIFFSYYILTFSFVYASALNYQLKSFEMQSAMLASELKDLIDDSTGTVNANRLFKNSPVFDNTSRNYPILRSLVPDNTSLYWPNQAWFITYTGLNRTIIPFDPEKQNLKDEEIVIDNYYYKIYKQNNNLYIMMK